MENVVNRVVARGLCSGCGVCVGICPYGTIKMTTLENGDLSPVLFGQCREKCDICLRICPFVNGFHDPREMNDKLFKGKNTEGDVFDENIGWHLRSVVGYSTTNSQRLRSSSGGLASWCIEALFSRDLVDRAAVVRLSKERQPSLFEFFMADSVEDIRSASGSFYHPVELSKIIKKILSEKDKRWLIIGVPCLCSAVRNSKILRKSVVFVFGLACGMYQNTMYTEMLLSKSDIKKSRVAKINYRKKSEGPADNFLFTAMDNNGKQGIAIPYKGLPLFLGLNGYFRLNACNFCMDVFAETADVCFMDAWLPEYFSDSMGTSLVVVRNKEIDELLRNGESVGELWLKEILATQTVKSQQGHVRRKRQLITMRLEGNNKHHISGFNPSYAERADWWLQKRTQKKSKRAWARYGRKYGRVAFWLAIGDLVAAQFFLKHLRKILLLYKHFKRNKMRIY